ncbi:MAG: hypothetical protein FWB78_04230, partial [Treponema sp.]|nr:hypothetical protein [Treponema sp.]
MKKDARLFGIVALVAVFGLLLVLAGCPTTNGSPVITHAVTMVGIGTGGTATVANQEAEATVPINAGTRTGYTFANWTSTPAVTFANQNNANTTFVMPNAAVTVTANWTPIANGPTAITIAAIQGVTAPATGTTPAATITETAQFTGTVAWVPAVTGGVFAAETAYTATITLTAREGFTLQGVGANFFTVPHGMVGLMAPVCLHVQYIGNGFARQAKNM